jgi:phosphoribosylaminoimidazole (AIR) synthetase
MVLIVSADEADAIVTMLNKNGDNAWQLGTVEAGDKDQVVFK